MPTVDELQRHRQRAEELGPRCFSTAPRTLGSLCTFSPTRQGTPSASSSAWSRPRDSAATMAILNGMELASLGAMLRSDATPLVRTDFTDDTAWSQVVSAVTALVDFEDDLNESGGYAPNITPVHDRAFEPATSSRSRGRWVLAS